MILSHAELQVNAQHASSKITSTRKYKREEQTYADAIEFSCSCRGAPYSCGWSSGYFVSFMAIR